MSKPKEKSELKGIFNSKENQSELLKKSLIRTRNVIRKKFRELHNQKLTLSERINEKYKPIIEPLKNLVTETKKERQTHASKAEVNDPLKIIKNEKLMGASGVNSAVFKTALPGHRAKFFTPLPSSAAAGTSSARRNNISGISKLQWDDNENGDQSLYEETENKDSYAEDLIAGQDSDTVEQNLIQSIRALRSPHLESQYGLRTQSGELTLGNEKVTIKDDKNNANYKYSIGTKLYTVTPGLTSLLLEDNPKYYTDKDLKTYKDMLLYTNAHRKNFSARGAIQRNTKSTKYSKIITQIFPDRKSKKSSTGAGMSSKRSKKPQMDYKIVVKNAKINYTYWDDPNELVDRLRLLLASSSAGHTGHNNEIISIIEELCEAKIIN